MIDDFVRPPRRKPKVIHPLPGRTRAPLPDLEELEKDDTPQSQPASNEQSDSSPKDFPGITPDAPKHSFKLPGPSENTPQGTTQHKRKWYRRSWHLSRLQLLLGSGLVLVIVALLSGFIYYVQAAPPLVPLASYHTSPKPKPKVTTVPSTLTGLPVDPSVNQRPVTAVMIENSLDARPQSGLDQAGVVFEALAEGGVTRFMALYQDTQPDYLGPVRSSRPYYLQWALGFDAGYAHVGGSPDALQDIKSWGVRDLDQFYNSGAYHRINSRYAPHNVYTSIANLNAVEQAKGYTSSNFTGFARKPDSPSKTPTATSISMTFSGPYYDTSYSYQPKTNTYERFEAGAPHTEVSSSGQTTTITPKVVIAMVVPRSQGALDSSGAYYSDYAAIGSGQVFVFQDGTVQTGTWNKASRTSQIVFTDDSGQPLELNAGQTWISAIATTGDVSYK